MKKANNILAILFWVIGIFMLSIKCSEPIGVLFILPFALGVHAFNHLGIYLAKSMAAQMCLAISNIGYFAWFVYIYIDAFYIRLDPQSPVALAFVGYYSMPVILPIWIIALIAETTSKYKNKRKTTEQIPE